jgi:predicted metal-dependent peptidase
MHDFWDQVPEDEKEMMQEKMKGILRGAVRRADNEQNGWGSIPADLQKALRSYIDDRVDWDTALRQFVGSFQRGKRANTFKVINRRTPYVHPGTKRTHLPNIAVAVDQSGSVDDEQLQLVFGVLGSLAKRVTFTVIPFDSVVHEKGIFEWKKGSLPPVKRVATGGTDFKVVCDYINDGKAGKVDGYIVITDGECYDPGHTKLRRAWVITPGHRLGFPTKDLVISMDNKRAGKNEELR